MVIGIFLIKMVIYIKSILLYYTTFMISKLKIPNIAFYNGNTIPQIGYGTYQLKGKECIEGVKIALKLGYRHIDTASFYRNQVEIKQAIAQSGIKRQQLYITSKLNTGEAGYDNAINGCNTILQKLGITYLDLLLIHWPGVSGISDNSPQNATIRRQTWRAMLQLRKQGKVKDIGVSNFLVRHLEDLVAKFPEKDQKPVINQFQLHPLLWEAQLIEYCRKHEIVIEAYSPLARNLQKLMNNKYILELSKKYKKTSAQIALRWSIEHNFVTIPKSKTQKYIQDNLNILDFSLSKQQIDSITKLNDNTHTCWNPNNIKY